MLAATLLALTAAVMHAGWNLAVKQSGDRFIAMWGQFFMAGLIGAVLVAVFGRMTARGWMFAGISGVVHIPYALGLVGAYRRGEFSHTYPVARGAGAMLAALGGVLLLGDRYSALGTMGLAVVGVGLLGLGNPRSPGVTSALVVAAAICSYSLVDAHAVRTADSPMYFAASHVTVGATLTAVGLARGSGVEMRRALRDRWPKLLAFGVVVGSTYALVQVAFRLAPVGYVTALRESSVVIAAVVGVTFLHESGGRRRIAAAMVVALGLVVLVLGR